MNGWRGERTRTDSAMRRGRGRRRTRVLLVSVVGFVGLVGSACGDAGAPAPAASGGGTGLSLVETLGGLDTAGYARATEPRDFVFPADHGPHADFRTEWWYVTGNLSGSGRDFGFQFTIFRNSLTPTPPEAASAWSTNQAYMGHLAITDIEDGGFHAEERFARGVPWLADAKTTPFEVYLEDWSLASAEATAGTDRTFPIRLSGAVEGAALDLVLEEGKPRVLQGVDGLSQKGPEPGNASYYYAHTRMPARGRVVIEEDTVQVEGLAWLDREWSTSALSAGQVGWDWFALQLDDGWDMMVYQLRLEDGSADPLSDGVLISPEGDRIPLEWGEDVFVEPTERWRAPDGQADYPAAWTIRVPERGWDLRVTPAVSDQELRFAFRYWEGSVRVEGQGEEGAPVAGRGYVELTGYAVPGS